MKPSPVLNQVPGFTPRARQLSSHQLPVCRHNDQEGVGPVRDQDQSAEYPEPVTCLPPCQQPKEEADDAISAKHRLCLRSSARPVLARNSDFAFQRTCATPTPAFSGRRLNPRSEMLWHICALPRKVSSGSPISILTCSQRNIGSQLGPIEHRIGTPADKALHAALTVPIRLLRSPFFTAVIP